jgi:hypothetical protein
MKVTPDASAEVRRLLDGDAVGVAGQVGQHLLGSGERCDLQQLGLALLHPCECLVTLALGAMTVAAAAVRYDRVRALGALAARSIAAKRRGPAGLNRAHHLQLCVADVAAVGVEPSGPEVAEDIGDFQSGTLHERARLCARRPATIRAVGAGESLRRGRTRERDRRSKKEKGARGDLTCRVLI